MTIRIFKSFTYSIRVYSYLYSEYVFFHLLTLFSDLWSNKKRDPKYVMHNP